MSFSKTDPVNVLVCQYGRVFVLSRPQAYYSKSRRFATTRGIGRLSKKWVLIDIQSGRSMGDYFGHFDSRTEAVGFMRMVDSSAGEGLFVADEYILRSFVQAWNRACKWFEKPTLTAAILKRYNLTLR